MISLAEKPQPVIVATKDGKEKWTDDKSTVFKRNDWYYLVWGGNYAMSKNLRGPYIFEGEFLEGGHNNVFQWKDQWYVVTENKDISLFYRGVSLKPLFFNEDGTVNVPENDNGFPADGRKWEFENSTMGWRAISGTNLKWHKKETISGKISGNASIQSSVWVGSNLKWNTTLVIRMKNKSAATKAKIYVASNDFTNGFWEHPEINWTKEAQFEIQLSQNSKSFVEYRIDLTENSNLKSSLKRIKIEPALSVDKGSWEIEYIGLE